MEHKYFDQVFIDLKPVWIFSTTLKIKKKNQFDQMFKSAKQPLMYSKWSCQPVNNRNKHKCAHTHIDDC